MTPPATILLALSPNSLLNYLSPCVYSPLPTHLHLLTSTPREKRRVPIPSCVSPPYVCLFSYVERGKETMKTGWRTMAMSV